MFSSSGNPVCSLTHSCDDFLAIMSRAMARDNLNKLNKGTDKDEQVRLLKSG